MKTKLFTLLVGLLALGTVVFLTSGCDSDLVDINNDPSNVSAANVKTIVGQQAVLVGLQAIIGDWYAGDRSRVTSIWTRQMCAPAGLGRAQPNSWNTYAVTRGSGDVIDYTWRNGYYAIKLSNDIIDNAAEAGLSGNTLNTYMGIAKFYKALVLGEHAALWGDIPIETRNSITPQPVFVKQSVAYAEVQSLLDQAIAHFQAGTVTDARDLNFQGDQAKWIASAYSLKARYSMHQLNYANALSTANQGISATANSLNGIWSLTTGEYSPWGHWVLTETGDPIRANKYLVDMLKSEAGDTRLSEYFAIKGGAAAIVGFDIYSDLGGTGDEIVATKAAGLAKYSTYNARFPLISYEETMLIRAEAKARTGNASGAVADLNVIRTAAGLSAKVTGDFATTGALITEILKQKYMELFLEGQAYHDIRRVHQTDGTPLYRAQIPLRYFYTQSEQTTNPNVPTGEDLYTRNELW
jgi:hypothetical protein